MFGERLRRLRREKDLTQEELARRLGVHTNTISKWEKGAVPKMGTIIAIAHELGTTSTYLLGDSDDSEQKVSNPKEFQESRGENIDTPAFIERLVKANSMIVIENGGKFMLVPATPEGFAFAAQVNR